jgi:hypothetical protein
MQLKKPLMREKAKNLSRVEKNVVHKQGKIRNCQLMLKLIL